MPRPIFWLLLTLVSFLGLAGCNSNDSADLLNVIDVAPRDVEVGDQIEVLGTGLPSGNVKLATVTFRGTAHRPGQEPTPLEVTVENDDEDCLTYTLKGGLRGRLWLDAESDPVDVSIQWSGSASFPALPANRLSAGAVPSGFQNHDRPYPSQSRARPASPITRASMPEFRSGASSKAPVPS